MPTNRSNDDLKLWLRSFLKQIRLFPALRAILRLWKIASDRPLRRQENQLRQEFAAFKKHVGSSLLWSASSGRAGRRALVISVGFPSGIKAELGLIQGLRAAGYEPVVLAKREPWVAAYYRLAGLREILFWDQFIRPLAPSAVLSAFDRVETMASLLKVTREGVRVGRFAASTCLRNLRVGTLDLKDPSIRTAVRIALGESMTHADAAVRILRIIQPQLALFVDRGYTPQGEIFDRCLAAGVDAVTWNIAHKNNVLMLKRYTPENRDDHPASLSEESWRRIQRLPWSREKGDRIRQELFEAYASGDWYSEVGTQFLAKMASAAQLKERIGLDGSKKTAVIFPHILWDGTFFWGHDLFDSYEQWLVETVRAACANRNVNWIIKIHPANLIKNARDGVTGQPAELAVIAKQVGRLPDHIRMIQPESDISTFSLYGISDYCVTVRGTVGIEAALFGIPVLTAGTGRYDRKGFTIDSETREEYLSRIARIQDLPRLTPNEVELAERFASGIFLWRPLPIRSFTLEYQKDSRASIKTEILPKTERQWRKAPDVAAFAAWVAGSKETDFLSGVSPEQPAMATHP